MRFMTYVRFYHCRIATGSTARSQMGLDVPRMGYTREWRLNCRTQRKQLAKVPGHIVPKKFALWVDLVTVRDLLPRGPSRIPRHGLKGEWKGYRAIRLNAAYRAIYQNAKAGTIHLVYVEEVQQTMITRKTKGKVGEKSRKVSETLMEGR